MRLRKIGSPRSYKRPITLCCSGGMHYSLRWGTKLGTWRPRKKMQKNAGEVWVK